MSEETLYETARPLVTFLTLYGVNWRSERRTGWRVVKLSQLITCWMVFSVLAVISLQAKLIGDSDGMVNVVTLVSIFCFILCSLRWSQLTNLFDLLKTCPIKRANSREVVKMKRFLWLLFCLPTLITSFMLINKGFDIISNFNGPFQATILNIVYFGILWNMMRVLMALPYFGALICLVVYYVKFTLERSIEDLKRCKSPLRRAKMTTELIRQCDHLFKLAQVANEIGAPLMFALKMSASFLFFSGYCDFLNLWLQSTKLELYNVLEAFTLNAIAVPYVAIFFFYLNLAPYVNQMPSMMSATLIEYLMNQDHQFFYDPLLGTFLLKVRVNELSQLAHLTLLQPPCTVLNEPVQDEDVFTFFIDTNDTFNLVYSAKQL